MKEAQWAKEMRECAGTQEQRSHPAFISWIHREGREELRAMGLAQLAMPDEDEALQQGAARCLEEFQATAEECMDAMNVTAEQVMQERRRMLAGLISEVVCVPQRKRRTRWKS